MPRAKSIAAKTSAASVCIMLVEDNPDHADLTRLALEQYWQNATLQHFTTATDAFNALESDGTPAPDLILLDLKLPEVDGLDLLAVLKLHAQWREIPVVVLTGSAMTGDRKEASRFEAEKYLVKPLAPDGFQALVEDIRKHWLRIQKESASADT